MRVLLATLATYAAALHAPTSLPMTTHALLTPSRSAETRATWQALRKGDMATATRVTADVAAIEESVSAPDGTLKLLVRLADGADVEAVVIPPSGGPAKNARAKSTVCVSSQVGCRQACAFCATGKMGLARSLSGVEILAQIALATAAARAARLPQLRNVVFMGMGEPGDNVGAVRDAAAALVDGARFAYGRDRVTVSTVGPAPDVFAELFGYADAPAVAWSLHSADEALRRTLVPTAKHSAAELRDGLVRALEARPEKRRKAVLEVVLIAGVNDGPGDADAIAAFVKPIEAACTGTAGGRTGVLVNLIPYNANESVDPSFEPPSQEAVQAFQARLRDRGVWSSKRAERGADDAAACGQLATASRRKDLRERPPLDHTSRVATPASIALEPIGVVRSPYTERFGTPRQPTVHSQTAGGGGLVGTIELRADLAGTLGGLAGFDYCWVVAHMHMNTGWSRKITPPRGPRDAKHGVFATRAPHRPSQLALSALKVLAVDEAALTVTVQGLDLLDGTPILDIKPYVPYCDSFPDARAGWVDDLDGAGGADPDHLPYWPPPAHLSSL